MLLTELETSARTENKRMTNRITPQLSRMDLPIHCAAFPELSLLNTPAMEESGVFRALSVASLPLLRSAEVNTVNTSPVARQELVLDKKSVGRGHVTASAVTSRVLTVTQQ
jgi:hypothetical protein